MRIHNFTYRRPTNGLISNDIKKLDTIVFHHTASPNTIFKDTDYHMDQHKWTWLGYGYYIDYRGDIHEARGYHHMNAAVSGHNDHTVNIALRGDFNKKPPTKDQYDAANELVTYLQEKITTLVNIKQHKDFNNTSCAGKLFDLSKIKGVNMILMYGTHGVNTKSLQRKLNKIGYNLDEDGLFGKKTEEAVKHFQHGNGLQVDGIVGKITMDRIDLLIGNLMTNKEKLFSITENNYDLLKEEIENLKNVVKSLEKKIVECIKE